MSEVLTFILILILVGVLILDFNYEDGKLSFSLSGKDEPEEVAWGVDPAEPCVITIDPGGIGLLYKNTYLMHMGRAVDNPDELYQNFEFTVKPFTEWVSDSLRAWGDSLPEPSAEDTVIDWAQLRDPVWQDTIRRKVTIDNCYFVQVYDD